MLLILARITRGVTRGHSIVFAENVKAGPEESVISGHTEHSNGWFGLPGMLLCTDARLISARLFPEGPDMTRIAPAESSRTTKSPSCTS